MAILFPTTPLPAAPIGDDETVLLNGQRVPTFFTYIRNTDPASNAALPGLSLPIGLPRGVPLATSTVPLAGRQSARPENGMFGG